MTATKRRRSKALNVSGVMNRIYDATKAKRAADETARNADRAAVLALDAVTNSICLALAVIDALPEADAEQVKRLAAYWRVGIEKGERRPR